MAGKKGQVGDKTENRGGKRSNPGGRPPNVTISQYQVDQMLKKAEKWAKERKGKTVDDILLMCIYGEQEPGWKMTMRDRIACMKIWKEYTVAKVQEKNINIDDKWQGPHIGLPPSRTDPAKIIPIEGGKK